MDQKTENTIIIGGGVSGLAAAVYLGRAGLAPLLFAGSPPGGQLVLTSDVENYPGLESVLGAQLVANIRAQSQKFGTTIIDENVLTIATDSKGLHTVTANGKTYKSKSLIIATGAKALWLGLDSEKRLRGKGVSACATCDGFFFRNKVVGVVGGGDTALEEALTLTKFATKVYVIHRRESFRGSKIMQERVLNHEKIEVIWNAAVEEVVGQMRVEGVRIKTPEGVKTIELQGLFVAIGHKPDTELFKDFVVRDQKGYVVTSQRAAMEFAFKTNGVQIDTAVFDGSFQSATSAKGVFAAGDCVDYAYRQAATATGLGVGAALDVERWLENTKES